jgi:Ser-tRNA(Ala) deacylase AlaX
MATTLRYLDDTYLFESEGTAISIGRDEKGAFVILDQSIFHPQGGGQPADRGVLKAGATEIPLTFIGFRDGDVLHYVPESYFGRISPGQCFALQVETGSRLQNARVHTAGHLVGHVLETIQPALIPIKGYHFRDGPYVEFINERSVDVTPLLDQVNEKMQDAISRGIRIEASYSNFDEIKKIRPQLALFTPQNKPSRIVTIGNYVPFPCGGTHLAGLNQIGMVRITKTKRAKENVRVSYEVREPLS